MKTPISYYGGKQQLAKTILDLIPPHRIYCEPFFGGAAVFFQKEPSQVEIVNDNNGELINFYEVIKTDFKVLQKQINTSLHSRQLNRQAWIIYQNPDMFDRIKRAWAIWMLANSSFGHMLDGGFGYDRSGITTRKLKNKRLNFTDDISIRLQNAQIECYDALKVIRSRDTAGTFFYCDPPYVGSDLGHYDGYTQEDFDRLLNILGSIQGKFLLSSFRNKFLAEATKRNGWQKIEIKMCSSMQKQGHKVEVLTANFPIKTPEKET